MKNLMLRKKGRHPSDLLAPSGEIGGALRSKP